ncbi:MAG: terminase small subunit [Gallionellaceae bacterium]
MSKKKAKTQQLTPKQALFCKEYLVDLNATQAAIRAGYAVSNADSTSSRLVSKSHVSNEIARLQQKRTEKVELTAEETLKHLHRSLKYNGALKQTENGDEVMDAPAYNKAIDLAMRHNAMLTDRKLVEGVVKLTGFDVEGE